MKTAVTSSFEERALSLLSSGISAAKTAEALGVDPSRISQLISEENFSARLAEAKFEALSKHNQADAELDTIESKLRTRMMETIDTVYKPMELTRMLQVVNAAKRRGQSAPENIVEKAQIINLTMPVKIVNKLVTNINNQVVRANEQDLVTIQSGTLAARYKEQTNGTSPKLREEAERVISEQ